VKTVPTVFLISGGNAIDGKDIRKYYIFLMIILNYPLGFLGVPDNNVLNHFYSTIDKLCGLEIEEQDMNVIPIISLGSALTILLTHRNLCKMLRNPLPKALMRMQLCP
jgi:hypothetical protein